MSETQSHPDPQPVRNWALCVATCDRPEMLRECVRHALASDLPPSEIVIVDASADWQANRAVVEDEIHRAGGCPLQYQPAKRRSLTVQRNQIVALATADILFMIDDDAMLHPTCARRILDLYAADPDGRIVAISARNTLSADVPVPANGIKKTNRAGKLISYRAVGVERVIAAAVNQLLMIPTHKRFVAYDTPERRWQGDAVLPEGLSRVTYISGFALTLRRAVALREPFDETLVGSSIGEDLDASYRFGRHGLLAIAPDAPIQHLEAAAGRGNRRITTALALLNTAYFVRRNSSRQGRDLTRYALWYLRMLLAEIPKDLAGGRWSLPQVRGALLAGRKLPALLSRPPADLQAWYQNLQMQLMTKTAPGRGTNNATAPDQGANG